MTAILKKSSLSLVLLSNLWMILRNLIAGVTMKYPSPCALCLLTPSFVPLFFDFQNKQKRDFCRLCERYKFSTETGRLCINHRIYKVQLRFGVFDSKHLIQLLCWDGVVERFQVQALRRKQKIFMRRAFSCCEGCKHWILSLDYWFVMFDRCRTLGCFG